ncbi:hypothetical protein D6777_00865 [Candidatus Woesearchaeota archaeon]|nr:MAG: hypothetical protein D6777_00865 [Candidatus Woesearchaeota archaeon]
MKSLESELEIVKKELLEFGLKEIRRRIPGPYRISDRRGRIRPFDTFDMYRTTSSESLSEKLQLEFIEKGIWPSFVMTGTYDNGSSHSDYINSSFTIYLSTNFELDSYCDSQTYEKKIINPNSILFLREHGITKDVWRKITYNAFDGFVHRRFTQNRKKQVLDAVQPYQDEINHETEYDAFMLKSSHFCNNWV